MSREQIEQAVPGVLAIADAMRSISKTTRIEGLQTTLPTGQMAGAGRLGPGSDLAPHWPSFPDGQR